MKKLVVAVLIIGTFTMYSFTHQPPSISALVGSPTVNTGSVVNVVIPTPAGASSSPPTSTAVTLVPTAPSTPTPAAPDPVASTTSATSPTPTPRPTRAVVPTPTTPPNGQFKDGSYTGTIADAQWGYVQVRADISQGRITNVQFLQFPSDRSRSVRINQYADPALITEAIQAQSAHVDVITGATYSSEAFMQSLSSALAQAGA